MPFDFDQVVERRNTDSLKYDFAHRWDLPEGLLPLWVADMDFPAPPVVLEELEKRVRHGIFGYSDDPGSSYFDALYQWYDKRFGWQIEEGWLIKMPGVVFAVCMAIQALTSEGDAVLIQPPVYYPFFSSVANNNRRVVENPLLYENGKYTMDFEDLEKKIVEENVKLAILCSPHNPVGRVWTEEELTRFGQICVKHGVPVVSDEIHADFISPGHKHTVFASISPDFAESTITCTAPTKTFNLAGLQIANTIVSNQTLRRKVRNAMHRAGYHQVNVMGLTACRAAYREGGPWLDALNGYLQKNLAYLRQFLAEHLPQIHLVEPEGTYLVWLDCRGLGLTDQELEHRLFHRAGIWLDEGPMFGTGGSGFQRINIACPRPVLEKALKQLTKILP